MSDAAPGFDHLRFLRDLSLFHRQTGNVATSRELDATADEIERLRANSVSKIVELIEQARRETQPPTDVVSRCGNCGGELNLRCDACGTKHGWRQ